MHRLLSEINRTFHCVGSRTTGCNFGVQHDTTQRELGAVAEEWVQVLTTATAQHITLLTAAFISLAHEVGVDAAGKHRFASVAGAVHGKVDLAHISASVLMSALHFGVDVLQSTANTIGNVVQQGVQSSTMLLGAGMDNIYTKQSSSNVAAAATTNSDDDDEAGAQFSTSEAKAQLPSASANIHSVAKYVVIWVRMMST